MYLLVLEALVPSSFCLNMAKMSNSSDFNKKNKIIYTPSGKKKKIKYSNVEKATKVHVYLQCFSLSFSKPERTS